MSQRKKYYKWNVIQQVQQKRYPRKEAKFGEKVDHLQKREKQWYWYADMIWYADKHSDSNEFVIKTKFVKGGEQKKCWKPKNCS